MISREELAAGLKRLDPRDWEVLDLSLRRRVPDEALAKLFETEPAEIARRRAAAIEHLADALAVQRGEDLGAVLKALLDSATWEAADEDDGFEAFAAPVEAVPAPDEPEPREQRTSEAARLFRLTPAPDPVASAPPEPATAVEPPAAEPAPEPATAVEPPAAEPPAREPSFAAAEPPAWLGPGPPSAEPVSAEPPSEDLDTEPPPAADQEGDPRPPVFAPTNGSESPEPVLEMLAERGQERRSGRRIPTPLAYALAGGLTAAGLLAAGWFAATEFQGSDVKSPSGGGDGTRRFLPERGGPLAAPFPSDPKGASCYSTAFVRRPTVVYSRPGGRRKLKLPATTEWGSPRVLSVVRRRGDWLAVLAPELKNGEVGWMEAADATRVDCVRWSLHVDLSRRRLYVRRDGRTVRKLAVAIGSKAHPTPKGRFAVTDKLKVTDKGSPYGCCVLALTGHQTKLPADWPGGDRLAVHATTDLSSIGRPVSLGCMRSTPARVQWLIKRVPLGSPIFIRA